MATKTVPRGPIAAMYSSPGPRYGLPNLVGIQDHDPRSVHTKRPAYSFGLKHGKYSDDSSPGPCYLPDAKTYRDGRDGTPHYSLYSRPREGTLYKTPGPGTYQPEHAGPRAKPQYPAYSFGARLKHRRSDDAPGANKYTLPNMIGRTVQSGKKQAPCYTLSGRQKTGGFAEQLAHTPGPAAYNTVDPTNFKDKPPAFGVTGRNQMPGDSTQKPGPGAYSPEHYWVHKRKNPDFSFGIRHSPYIAPLIVEPAD